MKLRLIGKDEEDLRGMALARWFGPLAHALRVATGKKAIELSVFRGSSQVEARLRCAHPPPDWAAQIEKASRRLFAAPFGELCEDVSFERAFGPFCPADGSEVAVAIADPEGVIAWTGVRVHRDGETPAEIEALDPDVRAVLRGLSALDRRDEILDAMREVLAVHQEPTFLARIGKAAQKHDPKRVEAMKAAIERLRAAIAAAQEELS